MFELNKYRANMFHDTKGDAKFEEKLACGLENGTRNWKIFTRALESLKIRALMG